MFSFFANKLTHWSGDYIDFSRTSILLRSGHRYTKVEMLARGGVILSTATSGFLCAYFNDKNVTHCSGTTLAIAGAALVLMGSHVIFGSSIYKRIKMGQECELLSAHIQEEAKMISDISVDPIIKKIFAISLATATSSNASQTWGRRKRLLTNLFQGLKNQNVLLLELLKTNHFDQAMDLLQTDLCPVRKNIADLKRI